MIRTLRRLFRPAVAGPKYPSLEIHVPISPTPVILRIARCFAESLRRFGGPYRDARIVFTVGAETIDPALPEREPWLWRVGAELRWLPEARFREDSFWANANERFRHDFAADVVMMLDADVLVAAPFDELVRRVHRRGVFAGLPAFNTPFADSDNDETWRLLFRYAGLGEPPLVHQYTGWGTLQRDPSRRRCPPYFNLGVLCGPRDLMRRIGERVEPMTRKVAGLMETPFRCQLGLTLALAELAVPCACLPLRYNFANHAALERARRRELARARLLHLHGLWPASKWEIYESPASLAAFVRRAGLGPVGRKIQSVLAAVLPAVADPSPAEALAV